MTALESQAIREVAAPDEFDPDLPPVPLWWPDGDDDPDDRLGVGE